MLKKHRFKNKISITMTEGKIFSNFKAYLVIVELLKYLIKTLKIYSLFLFLWMHQTLSYAFYTYIDFSTYYSVDGQYMMIRIHNVVTLYTFNFIFWRHELIWRQMSCVFSNIYLYDNMFESSLYICLKS